MAKPFSIVARINSIMAMTAPTILESKGIPKPMETHTGTGQNENKSPASAEDTSGALMAERLTPTADSSKPQVNAAAKGRKSPKSKELPEDQVAKLNNALIRIEEFFGAVTIQKINHGNHGRVVLLLPEGLVLCPNCTRVRMAEQIGVSGLCLYCEDTAGDPDTIIAKP
jgi:hypothetical protein